MSPYIYANSDGYYSNYYGYYPQNNGWNQQGPAQVQQSNDQPAAQPVQAPPSAAQEPSQISQAAAAQNSADNNPKVLAADAAVRQAQQAFDVERRRVLADLQNQPQYQQALQRRRAAQQQVLESRAQGGAVTNPEQVAPAAEAKLQAGDEVTRLQQQAIDADPAARAAEQRLHQAIAEREALKNQALAQYQPR